MSKQKLFYYVSASSKTNLLKESKEYSILISGNEQFNKFLNERDEVFEKLNRFISKNIKYAKEIETYITVNLTGENVVGNNISIFSSKMLINEYTSINESNYFCHNAFCREEEFTLSREQMKKQFKVDLKEASFILINKYFKLKGDVAND